MDISLSLTMPQLDRYQIIMKLIDGHITEEEARKSLGLSSVRQIRRIKQREVVPSVKTIFRRI